MSLIFVIHVVYGPNVETNLYMICIVCLTGITRQYCFFLPVPDVVDKRIMTYFITHFTFIQEVPLASGSVNA
jgi:hypothetical protein